MRTGGHVRAALLAGAAVLLTACASYTPAPIDRKVSAEAFAARRLDAPALQAEVARVAPQAAASWPPDEWDRASLLAVALAQNASLAVARAEVEAALAAEISAGEKPNPTLGLQSEYARSEPDQWLYGVSYDFLLPRSAVGKLDIALAQLSTGGARTELTERTWSVRRTLIAALSDRESAARRVDVLAKLAAVQDRLIDTRRQRVAAGEDASTDLNTAQATRIDIEQQLAQARANAATAQAAAAAALGMPPEALDGVTIVWSEWGDPPALTAEGIATAREQALLSRADLAIAVNDYAKAENRLERAIARDRAPVSAIRIQARLLLGPRHREMAARRRIHAAVQSQSRRNRRSDGRARARRTTHARAASHDLRRDRSGRARRRGRARERRCGACARDRR
ncbi:MAG TPA: TolC family protein, partial [Rhodanobacteraceae bacterium]|nr:TolC family protein [Rhodanobacteraceae bacterium]